METETEGSIENSEYEFNQNTQLEFVLNGVRQNVNTSQISPSLTLNEFLRQNLYLTGTKYMCLEGGCGACVVSAEIANPRTGNTDTLAVNSCLVSLLSCQDWSITTVEGLGSRSKGYDEVQRKIVQFNATQCGFCTPGMVMNMHALRKSGKTTMAQIENAFGGNICRCTGYRPILSAFKSMASDKDDNLLGTVPDIEDMQLCPKILTKKNEEDEKCFRKSWAPLTSLKFDNQNWYTVTQVSEIFAIFRRRENANRSYRLVAGNTAQGAYPDMAHADYFINICNVKELRQFKHSINSLILGSGLTLSETMVICSQVAQNDDAFIHLAKFVQHLDLVAGVPVRNIGTLAGNLMIKHLHNEFNSDIFLVLEAINARLVLDNGDLPKQRVSPKNFLDVDMQGRIIRAVEIPPLGSNYKFDSFKIMIRNQNASAIVSAAFLFKLSPKDIVQEARIVYGGIHPSFVHASQTEKFIQGKQLFDNEILQKIFGSLDAELQTSKYRKELAIALLYKFILGIAPRDKTTSSNRSGGPKLQRPPVSTGVQDYKTNRSMYPIGEPIAKLEAGDQASGEAKYITDLPDLPHQRYAAFVTAKTRAGSVLKSIDPSNAENIKGVRFFGADTIEGVNSFMAPNNPNFYHVDEEIFIPIGGTIKYFYQPIGMVVAKTKKLAAKAADLVTTDFEVPDTVPLVTIRQVMAGGASAQNRIHHEEDLMASEQDFDVPITFQGKVDLRGQYHFHMELQVVNVVPEDNGEFTIHPSTQWMDAVQYAVARSLKIPASKLSLSVKRVGGAFGAKLTRSNWIACAATLAASKLRKPVKFMMSLTDNMNIIGKRNPISSDYDIGIDQNGKIGYLNNNIYNDVGAYPNSMIEVFMMGTYLESYNSQAFHTENYWVTTDTPAATMMRGPGSFEGVAIIEAIMEHIAYKIDKDPVEVRLANLNANKHPLLRKLIDQALVWSEYKSRRDQIEAFNRVNRWRKKGISLVPMTFKLHFLGSHHVQVTIYLADGTVAISHGGIEMGQGINTKVTQACAYLLGIPLSMIKVIPSNNFVAPNHMASGGSITTECVCLALKEACQKLNDRINDAATKMDLPPKSSWLQRIHNAFICGASLTENHMFFDDPNKSAAYPIYGVAVTEVEVDVLTGTHIIQRVELLEDAGDSLNPVIDIGQCEGAFVMGTGNWTSEEITMDDEGALTSNNTWTYKPPGARDIPVDFRVKLPSGIPNRVSPYNNKATSEPPTCLAISVPLAIRHALKSARKDANYAADPWCPINGPSTVEWTFMNCLNNYKQYKL